ncbi:esterase [Anaeromyxobacter sp. K]|nr:esterase [Anaeromyxobacter sp. K]
MSRVHVELPDTFAFSTELPIRIGDMNYGGHLGNDAVLSLVHEARVRLFARHGWTELDVRGPGILMVDAAVVYRAEGAWGMTLRVDVAVADLGSRGCDLVYRLSDAASGKEIARAKTGIVFFDYAARRVVHVPEAFREVFGPR